MNFISFKVVLEPQGPQRLLLLLLSSSFSSSSMIIFSHRFPGILFRFFEFYQSNRLFASHFRLTHFEIFGINFVSLTSDWVFFLSFSSSIFFFLKPSQSWLRMVRSFIIGIDQYKWRWMCTIILLCILWIWHFIIIFFTLIHCF